MLYTPRNLRLLVPLGWSSPGDMARALDIMRQRARGHNLSVCHMYNMGVCTAADCVRLHVCHRHVLDKCPLDNCGLIHSVVDSAHNMHALMKAGLSDTPVSEVLRRLREQIRRYPTRPSLCNSVYSGQGCQRHCLRLHYCEAFARARCKYGDRCYKSHSLRDAHNERVLTFFGWTDEEVLGVLKAKDSAISGSPIAKDETPAKGHDDAEGTGYQDLTEESGSGEGTETIAKKDGAKQRKRDREGLERTKGKAEEEVDMERQEWRRKEEEWNCRQKHWERLEKTWQEKEKEWESKEQKFVQKEKQLQEELKTLTEKQTRDQETLAIHEREREALEQLREQEQKKREHDEENYRKEMAEKEAQCQELTEKHTQLLTNYTASEETVTTMKRMNFELGQQLVTLQMLLKESEDRDVDKAKAQETKKGKDAETQADTIREQIKKQRECLECSICLGVFKKPVTLGCSHTFCRGCIEEASRAQPLGYGGGQSRQCPMCRQMTSSLVPCLALENLASYLSDDAPKQQPGAVGVRKTTNAQSTGDSGQGRTCVRCSDLLGRALRSRVACDHRVLRPTEPVTF
ncbi:Reticulocyte-binding protein 2 a [Amphibalanus amphitrite]|uniref:RING-type E3 ubiquitin transferase n=1 Tax=Amphibalanus amphitrite TaxID=1232801 RepID=A0A6A4WYE4_AMPAM|nr:Reticulocyte-binding protein 2 a [Amphibalanus amphitrite]